MEVENEQEWLQGLYSFVSQGDSGSGKLSTNLSDILAEGDPGVTATDAQVN